MDISSQLMIFPATASSASTNSAEINAAIIGFVFGSLSRPPESSSSLFSWRNFTELVCMWLQASLSNRISFGNLSVDDVVALWRNLENRFVLREEFQFALQLSDACDMSYGTLFVADAIVVAVTALQLLLLKYGFDKKEHLVLTLRSQDLRLSSTTSLAMIYTFQLFVEDYCDLLFLLFMVCEADPLLLLLTFRGLRIGPPAYGCLEALLISFAMRLIQSDAPCIIEDALTVALLHFFSIRKQFQRHNRLFKNMEIASDQCYLLLVCLCHDKGTSHISALMRRMENIFQSVAIMDQLVIWWITILPLLKKETSFFCSWLVYNERHISSRCVTSQGEFRFTLRLEAMRFMFLWLSLAYLDEQQMVKQYQIFIESIQSQEGAAICVSKELFSVTSTWSLLEFILTSMIHNSNDDGDFARQWTVFDVGCEVFLQGQRGDCFFPHRRHKLEHNFSKLQSLFGPHIGACISQVMLKIVAHSGGLHTIQCFFFGSLTRPPESQSDFSFMPLKFTWMLLSLEDCRGYEAVKFFKSKMDFHLEGEY